MKENQDQNQFATKKLIYKMKNSFKSEIRKLRREI